GRLASDHRRLDRVRGWWTFQHVAPAVPSGPERGVVSHQSNAHAEHGEEEPRMVQTSGDVDPHTPSAYCRPAGELSPNFLNDLRLAGVRDFQGLPISAGLPPLG